MHAPRLADRAVPALTLAAALALSASAALAATSTGSLGVSATFTANCALVTTPVSFGSYSGGQVDAAGSLLVTCTNGTPYTVAMDAGGGSGATVSSRRMSTLGGSTLSYTLYQDAARSSPWGSTSGVDTVGGTGSGLQQSLTVYGRINAGQNVPAGAYGDSVVVTVSY